MKRFIPYITAILLVFSIVGALAFADHLENKQYEEATTQNCKQYEVVPEKYIEKIPDGCIAQYFKAQRVKEEATQQNKIDAITGKLDR